MRRVEVLSKERVLDDFLAVDRVEVQYETADGPLSKPTTRMCVERGDAAAVLIHHTTRDRLILVRQFRYPTLRHGEPWLLEIVAGTIDKGESPEAAARREVQEEIGFQVRDLEAIAQIYGSPGGLSEKVYVFFAEIEDAHRTGQGGGLEGEDVERVELMLPDVRRMLEAGDIRDAKTLVALQWFFSGDR